jgi:hypothetical protein
MSTDRRIPGQSVMQRLFRRESVRPMFGPNPSFFERFGLADPYSVGPSWNSEEEGGFLTFLTADAYYQDVYGVVGARSRMLRRGESRAERKVVGERLRSKGPASLSARVPTLLPALSDESVWTLLEPEVSEEEGGKEESVSLFKKRPSLTPAKASARPARAVKRPLQRVMEQPATEDEQLALVMHEILSVLRQGGEFGGLIDRAERLAVSNQAVRRVLQSVRPAARRMIRPALDERITQVRPSALDVAMTRAPQAGKSGRGLRRVLDSSPALATLDQSVVEEQAPPEPERRTVSSIKPSITRTSLGRDLPVARVLDDVRTQQASGRAGPENLVAEQSVVRSARALGRPTERVALRAVAETNLQSDYDLRRGIAATRPAVVRAGHLQNVVSRLDVVDPASAVPRPASIRRAVAPVHRRAITRRVSGGVEYILPEPLGLQESELGLEASAGVPTASSTARPSSARAATVASSSVPASKRAVHRIVRAAAAAKDTTSRGPVIGNQRTTVLPQLVARSSATLASASSVRPRAVRYLQREAADLPATPVERVSTVPVAPARRGGVPRGIQSSRQPTRASLQAEQSGTAPVNPLASTVPGMGSSAKFTSSRHALSRLESAVSAQLGPVARLSASPVSYVMVQPHQDVVAQEAEAQLVTPRRFASPHEPTPASSGSPKAAVSVGRARTMQRASVHDYVSDSAPVRDDMSVTPTQRIIARQVAGESAVDAPLATSPVAYVEPSFARRSLERRSPVAQARRAEVRGSRPEMATILARPEAAEVAEVQPSESAAARGPERRWRSSRHAVERGAPPRSTEAPTEGLLERVIRRPEATPLLSTTIESDVEPEATPVARGLRRIVARAQEAERHDDEGRLLLAPSVAPLREKVGSKRAIALVPESRGLTRDGYQAVIPAYLEAPDVAETSDVEVPEPVARPRRDSVAARASSPTPRRAEATPQAPRGRRAVPAARGADFSLLEPQSGPRRRQEPTRRRLRRRAAARYASARLANAKSPVRLDRVAPAPVGHVSRDLRWLSRAIADETGAVAARVPRQIADRATTAVRAALRDRHSVLSTSGPQRIFFEQVDQEPTLEARVVQDERGRVVRAVARTLTGAPQTVTLSPQEFAATPSATQWAEERGLAQPTRNAATPTRQPIQRVRQGLLVSAPQGVRTNLDRGGRGQDVTGPSRRRAGIRQVGMPENTVEPSLRAASPEWWTHRPVGRAAQGRSFDRSLDYLNFRQEPASSEAVASGTARTRRRTAGPAAADEGTSLRGPRPTARTETAIRRRRTRRLGPTGIGLDHPVEADEASYSDEVGPPAWALRARHGTAAEAEVDQAAPVSRSGGLLRALARADSPEDVVKVILERGDRLSTLSQELPDSAARLVDRMARLGREELESLATVSAEREAPSAAMRSASKATRRVLQPVKTGNIRNLSAGSSAKSSQGIGTGKVTKLASKLMDLIHLAESERRVADAQAQVRMAEDTAEARAEGTPSSEKEADSGKVHIKALQRDVLEAVLRELEMTKLRREDPDGGHIWW